MGIWYCGICLCLSYCGLRAFVVYYYIQFVFFDMLSEGIDMRELHVDELDMMDVTLLSVEETDGLPDCVKKLRSACFGWWLSSRGFADGYASFVYGSDGKVDKAGLVVEVEHGVRPVLKIANLKFLGLDKDSKFKIDDDCFTVISDTMALCDDVIGLSAFSADGTNDYEASDIKKSVDDWSKAMGFAHSIVRSKAKMLYERSDNNPIYKNVMDLISDGEFDVDTVSQELEAANRCYEKYKNVKLPRHSQSGNCNVIDNVAMVQSDIQKGLGD